MWHTNGTMAEWKFAQHDSSEELARLHYFSTIKIEAGEPVEFRITVREYIAPKDSSMQFLAEADKQVNQHAAPFTPVGWGATLLDALSACMENIRRFPYEPAAMERRANAG